MWYFMLYQFSGGTMNDTNYSFRWYEKLLLVPYLGTILMLVFGIEFLDGTNSETEKEKMKRFEEGLRRTNALYQRYESLTPQQILAELQSIHADARVILAIPTDDWGMGFYEMIVKICEDPHLTTAQSEQLVEMAGWDEFREYVHDNSARMELLFTVKRIGLTKQMLPVLKSLLEMVKAEKVSPGTYRSANHWTELELLTKMVGSLQSS